MDDNIHMEPCFASYRSTEHHSDDDLMQNSHVNGCHGSGEVTSWRPSHILDFSDLSLGEGFQVIQCLYFVYKHVLEEFKKLFRIPFSTKIVEICATAKVFVEG